MRSLDCSSAQKLMSAFIDSMVTAAESESLEVHVTLCQACQRQLQSYKSMRSLLSRMERSPLPEDMVDRKSTRLNSSHLVISYAVFCLKKKKKQAKLPH